jgi:hypothetical protein
MKVIIVVPTIRQESIKAFLQAWEKEFASHQIFVIEDNPEPTFEIGASNVVHFSWQDIEQDLGSTAWIIPRRTDCIRSYGYYKAWQEKPDVIITLDDDCYPAEDEFISKHVSALTAKHPDSAWVSTGNGMEPRGMPYYNQERKRSGVLNHGLWSRVPDFDAISQLVNSRLNGTFEPIQQTIPAGKYFPMCGMNLAFRPELVPALYFLLMGRGYEYDRFGDIWTGIFTKKICDHLGYAVTSGSPIVEHQRASNVWDNLRKETPGLPVNEELWESVDSIVLTSESVKECYREIAEKLDMQGEYWDKLRHAMVAWTELF